MRISGSPKAASYLSLAFDTAFSAFQSLFSFLLSLRLPKSCPYQIIVDPNRLFPDIHHRHPERLPDLLLCGGHCTLQLVILIQLQHHLGLLKFMDRRQNVHVVVPFPALESLFPYDCVKLVGQDERCILDKYLGLCEFVSRCPKALVSHK